MNAIDTINILAFTAQHWALILCYGILFWITLVCNIAFMRVRIKYWQDQVLGVALLWALLNINGLNVVTGLGLAFWLVTWGIPLLNPQQHVPGWSSKYRIFVWARPDFPERNFMPAANAQGVHVPHLLKGLSEDAYILVSVPKAFLWQGIIILGSLLYAHGLITL